MLIVTSKTKNTAIDWPSVESFTFDEGELPNRQLTITTKSGCVCKVLNPKDKAGKELNFEAVVDAWLCDYAAWHIWEGEDKTLPAVRITNLKTTINQRGLAPLYRSSYATSESDTDRVQATSQGS